MARYMLQNLPEFTSLVMETLTRKQKLYHYRVEYTSSQTVESPTAAPAETAAFDEKSAENRAELLPPEISGSPDCNRGVENAESDAAG